MVIFHAVPWLAPGGFVGVDIFFVISGFLITSILTSDLQRGSFSLIGFYERRVRRILPALCACLAVSAIAAIVLMPPSEMESFGRSLASVGLFSSNIFFWQQGGYFDGPSHDKPLLHTWSLSVEEQFYLVWPVLLALLWWSVNRRWIGPIVVALGLLSLLLAVVLLRSDPHGAFYLAPSRAWELALGAFLAVASFDLFTSQRAREVASWIGLAAIVASVFAYTAETPFPGLAALLPCAGAALLIHANRQGTTVVGRLLSLTPVVFIGLISYSLYLWHWPILVFSQIGFNRALTPWEGAVAVVVSVAAAALSWRYVEGPFRVGRESAGSSLIVLRNAVASLAVLGAIGFAAIRSDGFHFRANAAVESAEASVRSVNPRRPACHVDDASSELPSFARCISNRSGNPGYQVLVWGDSHADHFVPAVSAWASDHSLSTRQATKSACRPLLSDAAPLGELFVSEDCEAFNEAVLTEAANQPDLRAVVVSGYWASKTDDAKAAREFRRAFRDTISAIRKHLGRNVRIVVLGTTPVFKFRPATCFARASLLGRDRSQCAEAPPINTGEASLFDPIITEVVGEDKNAVAFMPWRSLCGGGECDTLAKGTILYRDHSHFTVEGGGKVLAPLLDRLEVVDASSSARRIGPAKRGPGGWTP